MNTQTTTLTLGIRKDKEMNRTFAVIYKPGRAWLRGKPVSEQPLKEHVEYALSLHERGELIMGGPFADNSGGLVLLEVDGIDKARGLVSEDPAVVKEVLTAEVYEWNRVV